MRLACAAALELGVVEYRFARRHLGYGPQALLTLRQVDRSLHQGAFPSGKVPATRVHRRLSSITRSSQLLVRSLRTASGLRYPNHPVRSFSIPAGYIDRALRRMQPHLLKYFAKLLANAFVLQKLFKLFLGLGGFPHLSA